MKTLKNILLPLAAVSLLAGCVSNLDTKSIASMTGKDPFGESLKTEYVELANLEREEFDWRDVGYFNVKGRAAALGDDVAPTAISERWLPKDKVRELSAARARLVAALPAGRTSAPPVAARAQAMFDCWMQEQEENFQPDDISRCRGEFQAAMSQLEAKPSIATMAKAAVRDYVVYFAFNSAQVTDEAERIIASAAAYARKVNAASIRISGHTDSSGPSAYNQGLADKRAAAVTQAFSGKINSRTIVNAFGESRLAISTGDGVREKRNRRVEITVTP